MPKKFPNLHNIILTILFTLLTIMIAGCGTDEQKAVKESRASKNIKFKKEKSKKIVKKGNKETIDNKTSEEYSYDATGKPDPFVPLITEIQPKRKTAKKDEDIESTKTPLQKYKLEELNLVAIIKSGDKLSALFEDMEKFGYIVNKKTLIGNNGGVVKQITPDNVIIEEDVYNSSGEVEKNIRSIKIQSQE